MDEILYSCCMVFRKPLWSGESSCVRRDVALRCVNNKMRKARFKRCDIYIAYYSMTVDCVR